MTSNQENVTRHSALRGAVAGLLSLGVFLGVAELVSILTGPVSAPAFAIGNAAVDYADAGADYRGMMLGNGAIAYALGTPAPIAAAGGVIIPAGAPVAVEWERDAASGLTKVVGSAFLGVAELQDLKGVGIVSDL